VAETYLPILILDMANLVSGCMNDSSTSHNLEVTRLLTYWFANGKSGGTSDSINGGMIPLCHFGAV
jgi:hypothetical protein